MIVEKANSHTARLTSHLPRPGIAESNARAVMVAPSYDTNRPPSRSAGTNGTVRGAPPNRGLPVAGQLNLA